MAEDRVRVLNPLGQPPPIRGERMAPRLDTLDGKTIYIVDVKFPNSRTFGNELLAVLREQFPRTTWVYRDKKASYFDDDPDLWVEIKERGHGMIQFIGH